MKISEYSKRTVSLAYALWISVCYVLLCFGLRNDDFAFSWTEFRVGFVLTSLTTTAYFLWLMYVNKENIWGRVLAAAVICMVIAVTYRLQISSGDWEPNEWRIEIWKYLCSSLVFPVCYAVSVYLKASVREQRPYSWGEKIMLLVILMLTTQIIGLILFPYFWMYVNMFKKRYELPKYRMVQYFLYFCITFCFLGALMFSMLIASLSEWTWSIALAELLLFILFMLSILYILSALAGLTLKLATKIEHPYSWGFVVVCIGLPNGWTLLVVFLLNLAYNKMVKKKSEECIPSQTTDVQP